MGFSILLTIFLNFSLSDNEISEKSLQMIKTSKKWVLAEEGFLAYFFTVPYSYVFRFFSLSKL